MPKTQLLVVLAAGVSLVLIGCASSDQPVPTKEQFKKTAAPPQWRGPGQPGGPATGPVAGPPGTTTATPTSK